ncbi:MAG: hypothetical protein J6T70_17370 [Bacteroidales bacterium]|nr:hypothetical protein [Bacteroidales bacterium]
MKIIDDIKKRKILAAPLDWGLGHAARSVPLIKELCTKNDVLIVCGPSAYGFLQKELPDLEIIKIDDWRIRYPKHKINFFTILGWIPVMLRNSIHEHRFVKKIIRSRGIDCVVSDNRYGLLYKGLECHIITHQVYPKMPRGFGFLENLGGWIFKRYLSRFNKVLIPDFERGDNLSGSLAADRDLPPEKFVRIGILSRFSQLKIENLKFKDANCRLSTFNFQFSILVLMSGQENQRTVLENKIIAALDGLALNVLFVRGVGESRPTINNTKNITFRNLLSGNELRDALMAAELIICRAGYSTLCDVVALKKRAVIIPTPGQTEQEYLAERLDCRFGFRSLSQDYDLFTVRLREMLL